MAQTKGNNVDKPGQKYDSFAYDPSGNKVGVIIKDGLSYTSDGNRIGEGYTVETGGGIYKMVGGKGVKVDAHNQAPQPVQTVQPQVKQATTTASAPIRTTVSAPTPQVNREDDLKKLEAISRGLSDNYFNTQKAQADKLLAQKLTDLQKAYDAAIAEGDISVREAERQFNEQKAELEKVAYQQTEATRAYGNEMGIQNSQQMMGLQQGDNARMNSLNNKNAITRDNRINDIRDRINAITKAKDLDVAMANAEHGYNLMGAASQAEQMHAERLYGTRQEDYTAYRNQDFNQQNMYQNHLYDVDKMGIQNQYDIGKMNLQHQMDLDKMMVQQGYSKELQDIVHNNDLAKMAVNFGYDLTKMDKEQINVLDRMNVENQNLIGRMNIQQGFDLEKIGINFNNDMTKMAQQFGFEKSLQAMRNSGQMQLFQAQVQAEINKENRAAQAAKDELARLVDPNSDEYKYAELQINRDLQSSVDKIYATTAAQTQLELILNNPSLPKRGEELSEPTDWSTSDRFGMMGKYINYLTGYDEAIDKYTNQQKAVSDLEKLLQTGKGFSGIDLTPWVTNTQNPTASGLDSFGNSITNNIEGFQDNFNSMINKYQGNGKGLLDSINRYIQKYSK